MYEQITPGDFVLVYLPTMGQAPQCGLVLRAGCDSIDVVIFPADGPAVRRLSGVWHKDDPRLKENPKQRGALHSKATFVPVIPPAQTYRMRALLDTLQADMQQLQKQVRAIERRLSELDPVPA